MSEPLKILLIEDNDEHAAIITRHIRSAERALVKVVREGKLAAGLDHLVTDTIDAVLLDLRLPDSDIDTTLSRTLDAAPASPIVVLSSLEDRDLAVNAVHEGAQDYICKADLTPELLIRTIYAAIERKRTEIRLRVQATHTQALFDLSQYSISDASLDAVLTRATHLVVNSLGVEFSRVLELEQNRQTFFLRAGEGWKDGYVGHTRVPADQSTQAGYTLNSSRPVIQGDLRSHEPVIVSDLSKETRFAGHALLHDHGVVSGMSVIIYGKDEDHPYGVLAAHSKMPRIFTRDEATFLQSAANTLAAAILRRQLEEELKSNIEELHSAHRRKDEFLATLSHELRTPLNVIIGNLELLKHSDRTSKEYDEALSAIERGARDESQLVADTLEMSRIITGKMTLNMGTVKVSELINSAIDSIRFAASAKRITIVKDIESDDITLVADEGRLRQVAWNLLSNAVKFTPNDGMISVTAKERGGLIELLVKDNGKGISPANLGHVFERFWQEESSVNRRFMGLGLGLAIVRHIVELHGGTVTAKSDGPGRGTTFSVFLPITSNLIKIREYSDLKKRSGEGMTPSAPGRLKSLEGMNILIIDDSVDSLALLAKLLERKGAKVTAFSDPMKGLDHAKHNLYDLVISDIGMPGLSGYDLMEQIRSWEGRQKRPAIPSIALTAYATSQDAEKALLSGFQRHLAKPIDIKALSDAIVSLVH